MTISPSTQTRVRSRSFLYATAWVATALSPIIVVACDTPTAPLFTRAATPTPRLSADQIARYDIIDLGTLPGGQTSGATAINGRGQVVGTSDFNAGGTLTVRGFLYDIARHTMQILAPVTGSIHTQTGINSGGVILVTGNDPVLLPLDRRIRDLGIPVGWHDALGEGINSADDIVGHGFHTDGSVRSFEWRPGRGYLDLTSSLGRFSYAYAINDHEEITGVASFGVGAQLAYVWHNGHVRGIGTLPGTNQSFGQAINNRGHVAGGTGQNDALAFAFLWSPDRGMRSLGAFRADNSSLALGMNDADEVVGISSPSSPSGCVRPFVWTETRGLELLPTLAGFQSGSSCLYAQPVAINDQGDIVGTAEIPDLSAFHAVLWIPRAGFASRSYAGVFPTP